MWTTFLDVYGFKRNVQTVQMVLYIHRRRHATNFAFLAGCTLADLGVMGTTPDERCVGLLQSSAQFTGGVVCYSGVTLRSLAVYVCNSTHHLEGPSLRECQNHGNWSGSVPQCVAG